jgi:hypothetical protein
MKFWFGSPPLTAPQRSLQLTVSESFVVGGKWVIARTLLVVGCSWKPLWSRRVVKLAGQFRNVIVLLL